MAHLRNKQFTYVISDYHALYSKKIRDDPSPSQELNAFIKTYGWNITLMVKTFIMDRSNTALILPEEMITKYKAHTCELLDIGHLFMQHYALGFQKESEIAPLFNYWILKAQQSGDLNFWRDKVRKHSKSQIVAVKLILKFISDLSNRESRSNYQA